GEPQHDPYGNPIPALSQLGVGAPPEIAVVPLTEFLATPPPGEGESFDVRLERIGEPLQVDTLLLQEFLDASIAPRSTATVSRAGTDVRLLAGAAQGQVTLTSEIGKHRFVRKP